MTRARDLACAAGLLAMLAAGCAGDALRVTLPGFAAEGDLVVPGAARAVSASAAATLRGMNLFVATGRDGESVRVSSATPSGRKFTLWFRARKGESGEQTSVRIEWAKEADEAFWAQLQSALTGAASTDSPQTTGPGVLAK